MTMAIWIAIGVAAVVVLMEFENEYGIDLHNTLNSDTTLGQLFALTRGDGHKKR